MDIRPSRTIASIPAYPFAEMDEIVRDLRRRGVRVIDFGVGDPTDPTPEIVREELKEASDRFASSGYPAYEGASFFREAVAAWFWRRFGVALDPETEVCATIGAKEAVFHFPFTLLDPGDVVLCPSPGYPPYHRGTLFAGGQPYFYPLTSENGFLPPLESFPEEVLRRARIIWVNYPNSPTGMVAPDDFWPDLFRFAERWNLIVASDESYSEVWFGSPPRSALEFGREGVVVFQSLSKRSNMTGYRVGFVAGDARLIALFRKLKTNLDSGTPTFIQAAAATALSDETHVAAMREKYRRRRDVLVEVLREIGCEVVTPAAALYVWPRVPNGMTGAEFARALLDPRVAVACTPGAALGEPLEDGTNPGERHVRFALVTSVEDVEEAGRRMRAVF